VIQEKSGAFDYHTVDFRHANAVAINGSTRGSRFVLEDAVLDILKRADADGNAPEKSGK
jgi:hypothetical protein